MELLLALALGITLSAASGFRVFIPPFVISLAAIYGDLPLAPGFEWVGTQAAATAFGAATVVEILAYFIPVVDNLLDAIEIPIAVVVGTMLTAANLGDMDPVLQWTLAILTGGSTAGIIDVFTSMTRLAATGTTGGVGNIAVSIIEALSAAVLSLLGLTLPLLAAGLVIGLLIWAIRKILKSLSSLLRRKE
jgi:hypothetical protein